MTYKQSERIVEIAFYEVYTHMRNTIPSDKIFLFVEAFSRSFDIDYTSISIAITQFYTKLKPTRQEKAIFGIITGVKLKTLGLDYRTIRSYREKFNNDQIEFFPRLMNRFLRDDLRKFVEAYYKLFPRHAEYLHTYSLEGGFNNETS
jgi:hypothetical protein